MATKFVLFNQRSDRPSGLRDSRPFDEACYRSFHGRNQNFLNFSIKGMLLPGDKVCNIDIKNAYFAIPLSVKSKAYVRFQWKDLLYEFCCFFFRISPVPIVFTKLLKVPISLLRELSVRIIITFTACS